MGVKVYKNPCDAWIYQEILYEVRPDIIIEIGSARGGSTLYLAHLLDIIGNGKVVSIDIDRTNFEARHKRIILVTGDSSSLDVIDKVSELCVGRSVLLIHDGGHEKEQVLRDLHAYSQFVSVNSYAIVEDGVIDLFSPGDGIGTYEDGPMAAVDQFLKQNLDFVVDAARERYIITYNPRGFLRRVKQSS
jgi:cephalosporin hydroxylase